MNFDFTMFICDKQKGEHMDKINNMAGQFNIPN